MYCKFFSNEDSVCSNKGCPYVGEVCPVILHPKVCKFSRQLLARDLSFKCGGCYWAQDISEDVKWKGLAYVKCTCPEKHFYSGRRHPEIRPRTTKACSCYRTE